MKRDKNVNPKYDYYLAVQINRSTKRWGRLFDGAMLRMRIKNAWESIKDSKTVCCMGIKRGDECKIFKEFFKEGELYGIEINPKVLEHKTDGMKFIVGDFNQLPADWTNKLDFIYSNSIDHALNFEQTLREWTRCLRVGGYLMLDLPHNTRIYDCDIYSFDENDWEIIKKAGYEVVKWAVQQNTIYSLFKRIK